MKEEINMDYQKCRNCKFVCRCCSSRFKQWLCCSGCESKDEFAPAEHIKFCPLDGNPIDGKKVECDENSNIPPTT